MKVFTVDYQQNIREGQSVFSNEKHTVVSYQGNEVTIHSLDRTFENEASAVRFALNELANQYKALTTRSDQLMILWQELLNAIPHQRDENLTLDQQIGALASLSPARKAKP